MYKNDLYLRALKGEIVERPPVWMMRQAGRYLPEFIKIREKYDFFTRCRTPELASEITVQPIRRYGMDAAILFSDILVIPQAMNIHVEMKAGIGPWLPDPIRSQQDLDRVIVPDVNDALSYVMDAIKLTKEMLNDEVPLIGFAGSPWTILCYCVQGQGSKNFDKAKELCFTQPVVAHKLLQMITDTTIAYLKAKVEAGVDAVQIFDSWAGLIKQEDFNWALERNLYRMFGNAPTTGPMADTYRSYLESIGWHLDNNAYVSRRARIYKTTDRLRLHPAYQNSIAQTGGSMLSSSPNSIGSSQFPIVDWDESGELKNLTNFGFNNFIKYYIVDKNEYILNI